MFNLVDLRWSNTFSLSCTFALLSSSLVLAQSTRDFSILEYRDAEPHPVISPTEDKRSGSLPKLVAPVPIQRPQRKIAGDAQVIDASDDFNRLVTRFVLESMPHQYVQDKDWGKTAERWDGVSIKRDGLKLRTKRKKKTVNHGTWKKYSAALVEPEKTFSIQLQKMRELSEQKIAFDLVCSGKLDIDARQSKWVKGVQLYSLSAEGNANVVVRVSAEIAFLTDIRQLPPDLVIQPKVTDVKIDVRDFRIDRISKAGGELAQQVTRAAKSALEKKIGDQESKLLKKMNQRLAEKKDKLRFSVADAIKSPWWKSANRFLPAELRQAQRPTQTQFDSSSSGR